MSDSQPENPQTEIEAMHGEMAQLRHELEALRLRNETALREAARVEAIATVAQGVAHDFNNLMVGVLGNASLLHMDLEGDPDPARLVAEIEDSARHVSALAHQIVAYAQHGACPPQEMPLNEAVLRAVHLQETSLPDDTHVAHNLEADLWPVVADPARLGHVIHSLFAAALESMYDGGRIVLTTRNLQIDEHDDPPDPNVTPGRYVLLSVEFRGSGIDEEPPEGYEKRQFGHHFHSRAEILKTVQGVLETQNGQLLLQSPREGQAGFRLYLPAAPSEPAWTPRKTRPPAKPLSGTALLVDDEPVVLHVTREMLERLGFRVLTAHDGQEAAAIARLYDGEIDLCVLDLGMPVMSGQTVFPLLKEARPNMKVILSSGYDVERVSQSLQELGADGFIHKPFLMGTLSAKIAEIIED